MRNIKKSEQAPKTVMFLNRDLINMLTEEEATAKNTTTSVIIENCVLEKLLPQDNGLQGVIKGIYEEKISVKRGLVNVFSYLATNGNESKRHVKNKDLVYFLQTELRNQVPVTDDNPQFYGAYMPDYLYRNIDAIVSHLLRSNEDNENMKFLCEMWESQIKTIPMDNIHWYTAAFNLIVENWEEIYGLSSTYKVLMELCKLSDENAFENTSLYELRKVLLMIEKYWEQKE